MRESLKQKKVRTAEEKDYLEMPYEQQIAAKQEKLVHLLGKFGKVQPVIPMDDPMHYRHKVHAVFGRDGRGRILCGEYKILYNAASVDMIIE